MKTLIRLIFVLLSFFVLGSSSNVFVLLPPGPPDPICIDDFLADLKIGGEDLVAFFDNNPGEGVKIWNKLFSLGDGSKKWVRTQTPLLEKMKNYPEDFQGKVVNYYRKHNSNADVSKYPGISSTGQYYDEFGHPDFTSDVPIATNGKRPIYKPSNGIKGSSADLHDANNWALKSVSDGGGGFTPDNFRKIPNSSKCKIKDTSSPYKDADGWVECTWHHHQDGKTLIPVPTVVHNRGNASHIGGVQVKNEGIIGFFDSPVF